MDRAGVLADVTRCLSNEDISIESFFQKKPREDENSTDVVLLTHECLGKNILDSIKAIKLVKNVIDDPIILRVESLK